MPLHTTQAHCLQIHVTSAKIAAYSSVPKISRCVTPDGAKSRVHACGYWDPDAEEEQAIDEDVASCSKAVPKQPCRSFCPHAQPFVNEKVLTIKPSAMYFQRLSKARQ